MLQIQNILYQPITWWRHQMETFSALLALFETNTPVTVEFLSQRPVTRSFDVVFSLCLIWTNGWVNNHEAGDLRHYRAHYDGTVMSKDHLLPLVNTPFDNVNYNRDWFMKSCLRNCMCTAHNSLLYKLACWCRFHWLKRTLAMTYCCLTSVAAFINMD